MGLYLNCYWLYWTAFYLLSAVGINDLIRIYMDQDPPITSRVREMTPKSWKFPIIVVACALTIPVGGLPGFMLALVCVLVGHFVAN